MLIKRNLWLFFRDKANVFFSLLSVFIIIGLYVLFLGDIMEDSLRSQLAVDSEWIAISIGGIMLGGMVAVTSVTSCSGAISISIKDKEYAANDFLTSPINRNKIALSYLISNAIIGIVMTGIALLLCIGYLVMIGGTIPTSSIWGKLLLTTILSVLCANSMMYFISLFIKSRNAYSSFSSISGTLIGFLMGIYIPIGQLPESVGWVIRLFPMSHAASMFRQLLASEGLAELFSSAPEVALLEFHELVGVTFNFGGFMTSFWFSALVLMMSTVIFSFLSAIVLKGKKIK